MAYTIRGVNIVSNYYGQFAILYPYIDSIITPVPTGSYANTADLILAYPWFPVEATLFDYMGESSNFGFVDPLPFSLNEFDDRFYSYNYSDIWTLSDGRQYKAWGSSSGVNRGITLGEINDSSQSKYIRLVFPVNANYKQASTLTSYNPNYDSDYGYFLNVSLSRNLISFTDEGFSFRVYPLAFQLTDHEKEFYANLPNDIGPQPKEDPYLDGGESTEGGGEGDFDTFTDEIPIPETPTVTVDNTGFISLYSPSIAQLKSLASYLWASTGLDLETFKRIFTDPISTILGLTIVPVTPATSGSNNVVLGNVNTGVSMPRISNQYVQFDCGTLNVNEFWGGYLDYSPYTSLEIYLPFIGTKPLNVDDVMGHTIHVVYNIDLLSGACCAFIESAGRVLYQFIGQCSCSVPVTGRDMTNLINGILSVVGAGAGTFVATGGNPGLSGVSAVGALASNVAKSKPKVEKSGSMGSMGGMLGVRSPYLIITRPRQALPAAQNRYTGYPSFITCVLSDLVGYTEVYKVHLGDIPATDAEKAEIETLLMNGVIL